MPRFIIPVVLLYTTALSTETYNKFGMSKAGYWGSVGSELSRCNCASPPCEDSGPNAFYSWMGICSVFLFDFYFTRGFSTNMRLRNNAAQVAAALARYDV
eukprot:Hpha_TRINITY_DN3945_c0_g1::TRINITY_DN3945_c0_g1_i1::g.18078::m.18078